MFERIRILRKQLGLTQKEFGEGLGISRDVMANIENNRVEPSESINKLICATYNVSYAWLTQGIGDMYLSEDMAITAMIDRIMVGENETAKALFKAFAKLGDEEWKVLEKVIDQVNLELNKTKKETGD